MANTCTGCREDAPRIDFTMAFQPIVHANGFVWGYEALARGPNGEGAHTVLSQVTEENRYRFDQDCRVKAIGLAARLFPKGGVERLSINFMPNAVYEPSACIQATLKAARETGFPLDRIMFEFTEDERIADTKHIEKIISAYRKYGFTVALDDFGAGYAGLNLLASFQPDLIKIDMGLIRNVDTSPARQAIVGALSTLALRLGIQLLAEGVETEGEARFLRAAGVSLFQGYLFGRPELEKLPLVPRQAAKLAG
jgi:EAL domain-containing protein (putative c-di-GMP-specific phosphodiesterase class I)